MDILALGNLTAVVDRIDLPETGCFPFLGGVEGPDRDTAFQGITGFGEVFPLQLQGILVFFQVSVYGGRTYGFEFFRYVGGTIEGGPSGDSGHLLSHEGGEDLPALVPEKGPDQAEGGDDLVGIQPLAFSLGGSLLFRFEFYRFPVPVEQDFLHRPGG
jgi:hypothetical protein